MCPVQLLYQGRRLARVGAQGLISRNSQELSGPGKYLFELIIYQLMVIIGSSLAICFTKLQRLELSVIKDVFIVHRGVR